MATVPSFRTWVVGEIVTAAFLNTNVRDAGNFFVAVPLFRGRNTAGQSVASGSYASIALDTEDIDSDNGHSTSTNPSRYVAQTAGWYQVSGGVGFVPNATGQRAAQIAKNGVAVPGTAALMSPASASPNGPVACRTEHVQLAVTDYVEIQGFQNSGGPLSTVSTAGSGDQTSFNVRWVHN